MGAIDSWLSIIASVLAIIATIIAWCNHQDLVKIRRHFNIGSGNKQVIKGDGNVQQSGGVNISDKGNNSDRK
jgi:hypothetical protein